MSDQAAPERLDKILANNGFGSRADARKLIRSGAVTCDGAVVTKPEAKFTACSTRITVGNVELKYSKYIYLMMHKPEGVLSATYDPKRRTVIDLLPEQYKSRNPFPAGRLDADTTGFILLTDDGDLAHRLLSPKKHVEKEYQAVLDKLPGPDVIEGFEHGVVLDCDVRLRPARLILPDACDATPLDPTRTAHPILPDASDATQPDSLCTVRVILTEGKFHQIKRMFMAYGIRVVSLKRIRMGRLTLDPGLAPGGFRELTDAELTLLLM